ncbi:MAG: hypothetical protein E6R08_10305 [Nevskiaceae bacterium]|nr:MAG: hypothetical protein E6R08_10305 [Nevskiaceae bacterium]
MQTAPDLTPGPARPLPHSEDVEPTITPGQLHHVHIYAVVRVKVANLTAGSLKALLEGAEEQAQLPSLFHGDAEYAEEITGFLVDPLLGDGSVDYDNCMYVNPDGTLMPQQSLEAQNRELRAEVTALKASLSALQGARSA